MNDLWVRLQRKLAADYELDAEFLEPGQDEGVRTHNLFLYVAQSVKDVALKIYLSTTPC